MSRSRQQPQLQQQQQQHRLSNLRDPNASASNTFSSFAHRAPQNDQQLHDHDGSQNNHILQNQNALQFQQPHNQNNQNGMQTDQRMFGAASDSGGEDSRHSDSEHINVHSNSTHARRRPQQQQLQQPQQPQQPQHLHLQQPNSFLPGPGPPLNQNVTGNAVNPGQFQTSAFGSNAKRGLPSYSYRSLYLPNFYMKLFKKTI